MTTLRVLHVIPSISGSQGGPSKAIVAMEDVLSRHGVRVTTLTTDDDGPGRHLVDPPPTAGTPHVSRIYCHKQFEFYKVAPSLPLWLWRHIREFDVVHIHALFSFSSMSAAWLARIRGVPYVLRPLGTLTRYGVTERRPLLKRLSLALLEGPALRRAAAVHFTSESERLEAGATGVFMRGVVIPLGIEEHASARQGLFRSKFDELGADPYVLYLSRLDPKKNLEGLLRAFATLVPLHPGVKLVVAGDGGAAYVESLKQLAYELRLGGRVVWTGHIESELKAAALAEAYVFVLPSFSENFGIAAAEALMAGLPCVLGDGVAIAAEVVQGGAGISVAPEPADIANALRHVFDDLPARDKMASRARALAREKYSVLAMGRALTDLYESIRRAVPIAQ